VGSDNESKPTISEFKQHGAAKHTAYLKHDAGYRYLLETMFMTFFRTSAEVESRPWMNEPLTTHFVERLCELAKAGSMAQGFQTVKDVMRLTSRLEKLDYIEAKHWISRFCPPFSKNDINQLAPGRLSRSSQPTIT